MMARPSVSAITRSRTLPGDDRHGWRTRSLILTLQLAHHISMSAESVKLPVSGMTCGGCARSVEKKLSATPGVKSAQVDLEGATATVQFDPGRVQVPRLIAAIEQLGFQVPAEPQS